MPDKKPAMDPNKKPRRALTGQERSEIFREFKLGLIALAVLVVLVVTLCWDRGGKTVGAGAGAQARELDRANLQVLWQPPRPPSFANQTIQAGGGQGGTPSGPNHNNGAAHPPAPPSNSIHQPPAQQQPPPPPPPIPPQPSFRDYVVKKGDTSLWKIASRTLGSGTKWRLIVEANPGLNPRRMKIGQVLRIPVMTRRAPASSPAAHSSSALVSMTTPAPSTPRPAQAPRPVATTPSLDIPVIVPIEEPAAGDR